ncbi:MAG: sodium-dependent transporter, partial [Lachnospiraceae bacterium]|nr:sodium-dependent transporter [Lachnospiraceae bacterium]
SVLNVINANPVLVTGAMALVVAFCIWVCSLGLNAGVEKITKWMMLCLLAIMFILAGYALTMDGAGEGLAFYLKPDFNKLMEAGLTNAVFDAMGQAFFTLSIGMGSIAIFGSYIDKKRSLAGEAFVISLLDTMVALIAGVIIFPACFTYGIKPESGPNLIFATLPNVFMALKGGRIWGTLFFIFLLFAALSTVIGVFENIISWWIDHGISRKKAAFLNLVLIILLSLPCVLGFNLLSGIQPFGAGSSIMDLEDFIVSNNILPIGSLVYLTFCTTKLGWGWNSFIAEANTGKGIKLPALLRLYVSYVMPLIIIYIFIQGYVSKFLPSFL